MNIISFQSLTSWHRCEFYVYLWSNDYLGRGFNQINLLSSNNKQHH